MTESRERVVGRRGYGLLCLALALLLAALPVGASVVRLPDSSGSVFAAEVLRYLPSENVGDYYSRLSNVLGPPQEGGRSANVPLALGTCGFVDVRMETPFSNGPGPDLRVYECGSAWGGVNEPFTVRVSSDGVVWTNTTSWARMNDAGKPYTSIELGDLAGPFLYVRVRGEGGGASPEGPEIIAIEALHPVTEPTQD